MNDSLVFDEIVDCRNAVEASETALLGRQDSNLGMGMGMGMDRRSPNDSAARTSFVYRQNLCLTWLWPTFAQAGLSACRCARNWRAAAREPSDMHMTMASRAAQPLPDLGLLLDLDSARRQFPARRCEIGLIEASGGRAIAEPRSWSGLSSS
jgi:hypothetical protein